MNRIVILSSSDLEQGLVEVELKLKDSLVTKRDIEVADVEKATRLKDLEKQCKSMRLEKEDTSRELTEAQEKLKLQSKELKDALQQRKLAMSEYTEVTDK